MQQYDTFPLDQVTDGITRNGNVHQL